MTTPLMRAKDQTLERHLNERIDAVETSLTSKINAIETNLTDKIVGVKELFTSENRGQKEAVTVAMTASDRANAKTEDAANDRTKEVLKRLDLIDKAIADSGGWSRGVGSSLERIFQIIASLGVIIGLFVVVMQHR